jgi:hypothetical protein
MLSEKNQLEIFLKNLIHSQQKKKAWFLVKEKKYSLGDLLLKKGLFERREVINGKNCYFFSRYYINRNTTSFHVYWLKNFELKDFKWINPQQPPKSTSSLKLIIVLHKKYGYMTWDKANELKLRVRNACILYF